MSLNSTITAARRGYANLKHLWARATRREDAGRRGVNLALLMANKLTQRENEVTLPYLTPQRAVQLYEHYRRGEFAPVMLEWEQMEQYDDTLFPARAKRIAALKKMRWVVEKDADAVGNNAELQQLADKQRAAALAALAKVENLDRILPEMGEADFGGICAIERTGSLETREVWRVIAPWHLYQPVPGGEIFYNAEADDVPMLCDELEPERVIIRRAPAANIPVMFLILRKAMTNEQWAAFIATYGLPNIFFELPPAIDERRAAELDAIVQRISSDGRGTMPNGAKLHVVETQQHDGALFEAHVKECKDAIITIVLGGTLTMETEAGSGTLAGNAHADSFAELCEGSAHDIGACVDEQFVRPLLRKMFPSAPILVHFDYRPTDAKDAQEVAQTLATLSQAGWKVSAETASEMLGFEVEAAPAAESTMYPPTPTATAWQANAARHAEARMGESGREVVGNRAAAPVEELPLTQGEMDALAAIGRAMDPEYLLPKTREIAGKLAEAMREGKRAQREGGEVIANGCTKMDCTIHPHHPSAKEEKTNAEQVFKQLRAKEPLVNESSGLEAKVQKELKGEVQDKAKNSVSNLKKLGFSKQEARRLHFAAAAMIEQLYREGGKPVEVLLKKSVEQQKADQWEKAKAKAKEKGVREPSEDEVKYKLKEKAWKVKAPVLLGEHKVPATADISVIKFAGRKNPTMYCLVLRQRETPA